MPSRKRGADSEAGESSARARKVTRTETGDGVKGRAKKAPATGATLSNADFKAKALPLHLNLTHTPPSILKEETADEKDNEEGELDNFTIGDVGLIGKLTLLPTVFSTKSYGWKGSKRLVVELQDGDTDAEGGKEKVQVMLTVNATVIGSKPKSSKGKGEEQEDVVEEGDQEAKEE